MIQSIGFDMFDAELTDEDDHCTFRGPARSPGHRGPLLTRATTTPRYNPLEDNYRVYFVKDGRRQQLGARGARAIWDAIRQHRKKHPEPASTFGGKVPKPDGKIDAAAIGEIVGTEPSVKKGGVVKVAIPRKGTMGHTQFGGSMGLASWAAFTGSNELAAIDGDFAMTASEVQPVLRALRKADIHVVALHNHMIGEEPAYYFTHFWAKGPAGELARGFRSALDAQREGDR